MFGLSMHNVRLRAITVHCFFWTHEAVCSGRVWFSDRVNISISCGVQDINDVAQAIACRFLPSDTKHLNTLIRDFDDHCVYLGIDCNAWWDEAISSCDHPTLMCQGELRTAIPVRPIALVVA